MQFTSAADTDTIPDYTTFSFTGTVSLPVDTAATQGDGLHHASYDGILPFDAKPVKWVAFCRGGGGGARDHLVLDTVQLKPVEGGSCTSSAAQAPLEDLAYEFYFGTAIPTARAGSDAMLDDGTGYASGRGTDGSLTCNSDVFSICSLSVSLTLERSIFLSFQTDGTATGTRT